MAEEIITEARVLDETHLELGESLPKNIEQRVKVRISPLSPEQELALREGQAVYQVETTTNARLPTTTDARQAMIAANRFIVEHLPDRFSAGQPKLVIFPLRPLWLVPVHLTYPGVGVVGEVGMLAVGGDIPVIVGWTPPEEMESLAQKLYQEKRDEIETALS